LAPPDKKRRNLPKFHLWQVVFPRLGVESFINQKHLNMGTSISVERRTKIRRRIAQEKAPREVTASLP